MLKAAMGFGEFEVTLPVDDILEMSLLREAGEHSRFWIRGIASKDSAEKIVQKPSGNQTVLLRFGDDENGPQRTRFSGLITNCVVKEKDGVHEIEAEALGYTFLLDTKRKSRSFGGSREKEQSGPKKRPYQIRERNPSHSGGDRDTLGGGNGAPLRRRRS